MTSRHRSIAAVCLITAAAAPALAEVRAELTVAPEVAFWDRRVSVRVAGTGCPGTTGDVAVFAAASEWRIELPLLDCDPASTTPFAVELVLPLLYPRRYTVRVLDANLPPISGETAPLATATLSVQRYGDVSLAVPAGAHDEEPVVIALRAVAETTCAFFDAPTVEGRVITAAFHDGCPILPPPLQAVVHEEFSVGPLAPGEYEVRLRYGDTVAPWTAPMAQARFRVHDADACIPSATTLCLRGGRFAVTAAWEDFRGRQGPGHAVPLADTLAAPGGDDSSGLFWFFAPDNVELTVKVLDGCDMNGRYWVFVSSGSTVRFSVEVRDTATGATRTYENQLREAAPLEADTAAFACVGT